MFTPDMILIAMVMILSTGGALALLIGALSPQSRWQGHKSRKDHDLAIARAQWAELQADRKQGLIPEEAFQDACLEIERRVSVIDRSGDGEPSTPIINPRARRWTAVAFIVWFCFIGGGLYMALGAPGLPGVTYSQRVELRDEGRKVLTQNGQPTRDQFDALMADLATRLTLQGGDAQGWRLLAKGYVNLSHRLAARRALEAGLARFPEDSALRSDYADILVAENDHILALDVALSAMSGENFALWRQGLVESGLGNWQEASDSWQSLLMMLPPQETVSRQGVQEALAALQQQAGRNESIE